MAKRFPISSMERADTKVRPYNNSLTLTLSQREREIILLSSFSQGLHHGLYSCHAVGAQKQYCNPVNRYKNYVLAESAANDRHLEQKYFSHIPTPANDSMLVMLCLGIGNQIRQTYAARPGSPMGLSPRNAARFSLSPLVPFSGPRDEGEMVS